MAQATVIVAETIHSIGLSELRANAETICLENASQEAIEQAIETADAAIIRVATISGATLKRCSRLKVIGKHGVGFDNIDVATATELGIAVVTTPGANADAVAETAVGMMLALLKRIPAAHRLVVENRFAERDALSLGDVTGKCIGIIGAGRIGSRVARICGKGFNMRVMAYDPYLSGDQIGSMGAEQATSLSQLLTFADVVTLHTPLNDKTRHMIGPAEFDAMKKTAILINTARGPIVDQAALVQALREKRIRGAALDVFDPEPPEADSPLFELPDLLLAPHIAGMSEGSLQRMAKDVAANVLAVLAGKQPSGLINPAMWPHRRQ